MKKKKLIELFIYIIIFIIAIIMLVIHKPKSKQMQVPDIKQMKEMPESDFISIE
ncbi:hypothetical protein SH1V18_38450 [Vallitalea longa]|uniref:Uncharacterized protein n=1 Tax=Vallitalea longa TaxID=2936439 RepID=A0A9W6DG85_9FIRM|nr:hypothetical protein [Vallitalea longa]GKX31365.1 hypothetical protein SH1V18_38450 [Vallitalea longa]